MRRRGLTMGELVVAVGLLGLMIVSLIALFLGLLSAAGKTTDLTAGDIFAQKRLQSAIDQGLRRGQPPISSSIIGVEQIYTNNQVAMEYAYNLSAILLYDPGPQGAAGYYLQIDVSWMTSDPTQERSGMGRTSTRVGRVVHVEP